MIYMQGQLWAGTEAAYAQAVQAAEKISARWGSFDDDDEDDDNSLPYRMAGSTAIVSVKGPMLNVDLPDWLVEAFGLTTYPSLQRQFAALLADEAVENVVLDVNSGGGHVSGLNETVQLLRQLAAAKPVETYAGDMMTSAAYWLGSVGKRITASDMSTVGSIGVIAVHLSKKGAYEANGYKPTVMRAGEKKHLGHELEDFTPEAQAEMQKSLDFYHGKFKAAVAENRKLPLPLLDGDIGSGAVFYGEEAVQAGLVDRIGTFSDVLAGLKPADDSKPFHQPRGFIAAHSKGLTMNLEEALVKVAELDAQATANAENLAQVEAAKTKTENELTAAQAANKALAESLAASEALNADFAAVLEANINAKAAALGAKVLMPESLKDKLAMNKQLEVEFQAAFPAGGVAAATPEQGAEASQADTPVWLKTVIKD